MSEYNVTKFYRMYIIPIKCKIIKLFIMSHFMHIRHFLMLHLKMLHFLTFKNVAKFNKMYIISFKCTNHGAF